MTHDEILEIFKKTGALLEGHFQLTSGLHSPHYFQCARVLQYPGHARALCSEILTMQPRHSDLLYPLAFCRLLVWVDSPWAGDMAISHADSGSPWTVCSPPTSFSPTAVSS